MLHCLCAIEKGLTVVQQQKRIECLILILQWSGPMMYDGRVEKANLSATDEVWCGASLVLGLYSVYNVVSKLFICVSSKSKCELEFWGFGQQVFDVRLFSVDPCLMFMPSSRLMFRSIYSITKSDYSVYRCLWHCQAVDWSFVSFIESQSRC